MFQDWIVAPTHYTAFRCEGLCAFPLQNHMNATNHAIMQSLVSLIQQSSPHHHQGHHQEALSNPCCSPIDLDPITVLYFDDSRTVLYKKYKDMIVRSCGCHWFLFGGKILRWKRFGGKTVRMDENGGFCDCETVFFSVKGFLRYVWLVFKSQWCQLKHTSVF